MDEGKLVNITESGGIEVYVPVEFVRTALKTDSNSSNKITSPASSNTLFPLDWTGVLSPIEFLTDCFRGCLVSPKAPPQLFLTKQGGSGGRPRKSL